MSVEEVVRVQPATLPTAVHRLQSILTSTCSKIETGDFHQSQTAPIELIEFLNSVFEDVVSNPDNETSKKNAFLVLAELLQFLCSTCLNHQNVLDVLSFELPKTVAKLAIVSDECRETVENIITHIISNCNPRDMLSVLCEALDSPITMFEKPAYFAPLLSGLEKVFLSLQRRQFEQIKEAIPAVLHVLKFVCVETNDEVKSSIKDLIARTISIAASIREVCQKLDDKRKEQLQALLSLFVLETMVHISCYLANEIIICTSLMLEMSRFLPFCGLSYLGLITGGEVDTAISIISGEDDGDYISCFSFVKQGACIAVICGYMYNEVAVAAREDFVVVQHKLRGSRNKRWQAIGMLKYVLSSTDQPWVLKKHAIKFLLSMLDENIHQTCDDEKVDCSLYMPSLFVALQAIEKVIIYASSAELRKNAFSALKKVLGDIPCHERFDIFKALITNSSSPSMIALLLDLVRGELVMENSRRIINSRDASPSSLFWSSSVLDLVEFVLRPPDGGAPCLPDQTDAVLSALNLYRFLLLTESTGKTNYTGVLSKGTLQKVHTEWLLPLRTLVTRMMVENKEDSSEMAMDINCSFNPVEMVLYRCIELVEDKLRSFS